MRKGKALADRIVTARLHGTASRRAGWSDPVGQQRRAALEELREVAGGRADLLAEVAGVLLGAHPPGSLCHQHHRIAAELLIEAGADVEHIERWKQEGARRAARPRPGG